MKTKFRAPRRARAAVVGSMSSLAFAAWMPACSSLAPAVQEPPPADTPPPASPPAVDSAALNPVSWSSPPATPRAALVGGSPIPMAAGARCTKFRRFPYLSEITRDTLVEDSCLAIPSDTMIRVQSGVTLGILATNGLRVGKNVTIYAAGPHGRQGARADFASVAWRPDDGHDTREECRDAMKSCACPDAGASLLAIRGHPGEGGMQGGSVLLVSAEISSASALAGFGLDVTGGKGGPPGQSGRRSCGRGELLCSSVPCSLGASDGPVGSPGRAYLAIFGSAASAALKKKVTAAVAPPEAVTLAPPGSALEAEASSLRDQAFRDNWDRLPGDDMN